MRTISASTLIKVLSDDVLYSNRSIAMHTTNYIALKNNKKLHFFGYLYGARATPIVSMIPTVKYVTKNDIVHNFMPFPFNIIGKVNGYREMAASCNNNGGNGVETLRNVLSVKGDVESIAREMNSVHVHLVASILATGVQFIYGESINKFDARQLSEFVDSSGRGLLDVFDSLILDNNHLHEYFVDNSLPLPEMLYPNDKYNTKIFLDLFELKGWDQYNPSEDFKLFYSSPAKCQRHSRKSEMFIKDTAKVDTDENQLDQDIVGHRNINYAFYKSGEYWTIIFNGEHILLKDSKGISCIYNIIKSGPDGISVEELEKATGGFAVAEKGVFDENHSESTVEHGNESTAVSRQKACNDGDQLINAVQEKRKKLEEQHRTKEISFSTYEIEMKKMDDAENYAKNMGKIRQDKNYKRIYDNITKAVRSAQEKFRKKVDLYKHIQDSCVQNKRMYRYLNADGIKWKLFP